MIIHTLAASFKQKFAILLHFLLFFVSSGSISALARDFTLKGSPQTFVLEGPIVEDGDISGIALAPDGRGILVSDEGSVVQSLAFAPDRAAASTVASLRLAPATSDEIDAEGATFDGGYFYVTGSHGVSKKKGKFEESRYGVFRFRTDENGRMSTKPERKTLIPILAADPVLGSYFKKPLQQRGINIEGLASKNGQLYFGLRSPNLGGKAFVIQVEGRTLFDGTSRGAKRHELKLPAGEGIRDIAATEDGFLLLSGNAGADASDAFPESIDNVAGRGFGLYHWIPGSDPVAVGRVPDRDAKAESLLVLGETAGEIALVILFDGKRGGAPLRVAVAKS